MFFSGISKKHIENLLGNSNFNIEVKRTVSSTNTLMKEKALAGEAEFSVLIASKQTAGRGRMGRSFYSPEATGVYMSILLKPAKDRNPLLITTDAAVCCARVFDRLSGEDACIKWVNDIYMNGRKVCGILTEGVGDSIVLGIGINILPPKKGFPDDIKDRAGAVFETDSKLLKERVVAELLREIKTVYSSAERKELLEEYRKRSLLTDKEIIILNNISGEYQPVRSATVVGIDDDYSLIVKNDNGEIETLNSGDVSIKEKLM